jgi:hypothetical protein
MSDCALTTQEEFFKSIVNDSKDDLQYVTKVISKEAVNEEGLIKQILYTVLSAKSNQPTNLAINAPAGEGKTHAVIKTIELFPTKDIICIANMTPKALFHRPGQLVIKDQAGNYISLEAGLAEIDSKIRDCESERLSTKDNNIKQALRHQIEELQQEKKNLPNQSRKLIDLTGLTLVFLDTPPVELFAAIMSLLSHDRNEAEYNFTDTNNGIKTKTNVLRGFPAIIFTAAIDYSHYKRFPEIQRRFNVVNPKMTKEKYNNAVKQISIKKSIPKFVYEKMIVADTEKDKAREIIMNIQQDISEICSGSDKISHNEIFNPYYQTISDFIPNRKAADMSAADRFFDFISLSTLVNFSKRPRIKLIKNKDTLVQKIPLATFDDLREAMSLMDYNNGVRPYILEWYDEVFLPTYNDKSRPDTKNDKTEDRIAVTTKELMEKTLEIKGISFNNQKLLENYIYPLLNCNYISSEDSQIDRRAKIYYPVNDKKENNNNLFQKMKTNNLSQTHKLPLQDFMTYPSKEYINSNIQDIMRYSSEHRSFILEDEDGIEKTVDEIVDRYYSNADNYFILDKRAVMDVSEEYHESHQNAMKSELTNQLDEKNLEKNTEETKDLFGAGETNNLLSSKSASDTCGHMIGSGSSTNENGDAEAGSFSQFRKADGAAISIKKITTNQSHVSMEEIDKFFIDDPDSIYRSPPEHTLEESPCKSIIKIDKNGDFYCIFHPDIKYTNLETVEHHIKYSDSEFHKSKLLDQSSP